MSEAQQTPRPFYKSPWLWGFIVGAVFLTALKPLQQLMLHAPPPLAEVGAWELVDQDGRPFGTRQLQGKVWVADYFFTRCPSICPELTRSMKKVTEAFERHGDKVHFVSFSVDPDHDTPEKLKAYAARFGADPARWTFVTGDKEKVIELITKRMFVPVGEKTPLGEAKDGQEQLFDISHLGRFALFDQNGALRGTFTTDIEGLGALGNATQLLVEHGPNP